MCIRSIPQQSTQTYHAIGSMCIRYISSTCPILQYENNVKVVENNPHIARQLSKPSDTVKAKHKAWSKIASKFQIGYSKQQHENGLDYYNFAPYEDKGLAKIHTRSFDANVLLEIRDVRVPASSHHPSFTRLARHRTHLICYTHADLIDDRTRDKVEQWTLKYWPKSQSVFVDTRAEKQRNDEVHYFDELLDTLLDTMDKRGGNATALTVGVANVGKSSVLQALLRLCKSRDMIPKVKVRISQKKKGTKKASMPGILDTPGKTREITDYLLRDKPRAFFVDVPGITPPLFLFKERPAAWFAFGAVNLLPLGKNAADDIELHKSFCNYILTCANRDRVFVYVDKLGLDEPTNNVDDALSQLANGSKYKNLDEDKLWLKRCELFLKLYNTGNFGSLVLDDLKKPWKPFTFKDEHFKEKRSYNDDDDEEDEYYSRRDGRGADRGSKRQHGRRNRDESFGRRSKRDDWRDKDEWFQTP